ncbi:hypothetical protein RB593_006520 [Gaeumannomyces tritici]
MGNQQPYPDLEDLWYDADSTALRCCECGEAFGTNTDALVRTFRVFDEMNQCLGASRVISTPPGVLVLYDRHLECLLKAKVPYITISHVWDTEVSATQYKGRHSPQDEVVRHKALNFPTHIARSISQSVQENRELWHDYVSVPQWTPELKTNILESIHKIYNFAILTVVHLNDVAPVTINAFTRGESDEKRRQGMLGICRAKWFSRVWTAMEYIRSPKVWLMDSELQLHTDENANSLFRNTMNSFWAGQVIKAGSTHKFEADIDISHNIVPWNLGPLDWCRNHQKRNFGLAFSLLARRGCQSRDDFLYALHGIVTGSTAEVKGMLQCVSWEERYIRIALYCIEAGDYTPLLITPEWAPQDGEPNVRWMPANNVREGYHDNYAYSIGSITAPPRYHAETTTRQDDNGLGRVTLRLQQAGTVSKRVKWHEYPREDLMRDSARNLASPSVEGFLDAYGSRQFFIPRATLLQRLFQHQDGYQKLERTVEALSRTDAGQPWPGGEVYSFRDVFGTLDIKKRLDYHITLGNILHLTWRRYCILATCHNCGTKAVVNAALYGRVEDALGATMHRIPGLGFSQTMDDGVCLLLSADGSGRIIGRAIWATPACACAGLDEMVTVQLPRLPLPQPREGFLRALGRV